MSQKEKIFSVSEFISFLNSVLRPQKVTIQGEIGEKIDKYERYSFFSLLDKKTKVPLRCFLWQNVLTASNIELKAGDEVKLFGYPEIFEKRGNFSFQVRNISLIGEGRLKEAFEKLKKKLAAQGFFAPERKKQIPRFPEKIGLITSKSGRGALPDFRKHIGEYGVKIYFYDVRVEGLHAMDEITKAIRCFNENLPDLDVLVLVRGGGSWESLQPFNSEPVAKSILSSKIPVICGVGHEADKTIAGFTSDLDVSTPTDAGKVISENWKKASENIPKFEKNFSYFIKQSIKEAKEKNLSFVSVLNSALNGATQKYKEALSIYKGSLIASLKNEINAKSQKISVFSERLDLNFKGYFQNFQVLIEGLINKDFIIKRLLNQYRKKVAESQLFFQQKVVSWKATVNRQLNQQEEKLRLSSPILKLKQGYTITKDSSGKIIKNLSQIAVGQIIKTQIHKGHILSQVTKK